MKTILALLTILSINFKLISQAKKPFYIKLDNGISISNFVSEPNLNILDKKVSCYANAIGLDYLINNWMELSTQISYLQIGGKEVNIALTGDNKFVKQINQYIQFNTTFRIISKKSELRYFIGIGPTLNILTSNEIFKSELYDGYKNSKIHLGLKPEIGILTENKKVRVGFTFSLQNSFSKVAQTDFVKINSKNLLASLSIGYKLGQNNE